MTESAETETEKGKRGRKARESKKASPQPSGGPIYGLGMIGALVYFAGRAESGQDYLVAVGKAMVWPAFLVYEAFRKLDA